MLVLIAAGRQQEGPLWRAPFDGSEPQRLASRATWRAERLDDGRYVSPVSMDSQYRSTLLLLDPESQEELWVDGSVAMFSLDPTRSAEDGTIRYSVQDGERSGVYLARLPAPADDR